MRLDYWYDGYVCLNAKEDRNRFRINLETDGDSITIAMGRSWKEANRRALISMRKILADLEKGESLALAIEESEE